MNNQEWIIKCSKGKQHFFIGLQGIKIDETIRKLSYFSVSAVAGFNSNFRLPGTRKDTVSHNVK